MGSNERHTLMSPALFSSRRYSFSFRIGINYKEGAFFEPFRYGDKCIMGKLFPGSGVNELGVSTSQSQSQDIATVRCPNEVRDWCKC